MATIRKRRKKDGSFSYLARIRIARTGQPDYSASKTFPKKAMAIIQRQPRKQVEPRIFPYGAKSVGTRWRAAR